jgi:hypothetical protein
MALEADLVPSLGKQPGQRRGVRPVAVHAGSFVYWGVNITETITARLLGNIIMTFVTDPGNIHMQHCSLSGMRGVARCAFMVNFDG